MHRKHDPPPFKTSLFSACLLSILILPAALRAQGPAVVTFLKSNGKAVPVKDSADYIRTVSGPGTDGLYELLEKYTDGQTKRVGKVTSRTGAPKFRGKVIAYFKNGHKESVLNYESGRLTGNAEYYYKNGKTQREITFLASADTVSGFNQKTEPRSLMENYYDTLGNRTVTDGNGYAIFTAEDDGDTEEGAYKNGVKEGIWKGTFLKKKYSFEETYEKGSFVNGVSTDSLGQQHNYSKTHIKPNYPDGIRALLKFVAQNYRYPKAAVQQRVNGQVLLNFVIDTIGNVTDIKVLEDPGYGTAEEAVRIVNMTQRWEPGLLRGIPVRVSYQLPIRLRVGPRSL